MDTIRESKRGHREPALLDAARGLFFKRGYAGTSVEQVANKAGFSKRTVYLYFKNKNDLFLTVAEEGMIIFRQRLEAIPLEDLSVEECVERILEVYLDFFREHEPYYRIIFQESTAEMIKAATPELRKRLAGHERACLNIVGRVAERAVGDNAIMPIDPVEAAIMFWGATAGILLLSMGGSQTVFTGRKREQLIRKAVWTLLAGLQRIAPEN